MARIPYLDPEHAPEDVREAFTALPVHLNVFKLVAHAETGFRPFLRYGGAILARQALPARLRELAILRVARLAEAEYEWVQHVPIARRAGVRDEQIAALERGDLAADCFDADERLLLEFTDDVVRHGRPPRERFAALAARLSHRELVELVLAIGFYLALARFMTTFEIDLDPPAGDRVVASIRQLVVVQPSQGELSIQVNGSPRRVPVACSVAELLRLLALSERRVAVAVNRMVVPRSGFAGQSLAPGDRVEILEAVGGG